MTDLLRTMLADIGMTPEDHARAKAQSGGERLLAPAAAVQRSSELDRVLALPKRIWELDGERLADALTAHLRFPGGPNPYPGGPPLPPGTQRLRPVQAAALRDAHDYGLFGPLRVGAGKTLVSLLAFVVLDAKRPLLILPAKLIEKTRREMHLLRRYWLVPYTPLLSYEMLGREQSADTLEERDPDVIVADECFPYDTKVLTEKGEVSIGDIVEHGLGRHVLSRSESGNVEWKAIVRRIPRAFKPELVKVTHEHGAFVCTSEHRIWTERGYVEAGTLTSVDRLRALSESRSTQDRDTRSSRVACVEVLERESVERSRCGRGGSARLYDLEVEDNHNYFADGVLVSNCHKLKNRSAACTRRVGRHLEAHAETRFIAMSGTITKRSIRDYSHLIHWCLKDLAPTPRDFNTLTEWSLVLDEQRVDENRIAPGALIELCTPEERANEYPLDPVRTVRRAYRRRLTETPGVVATQEGALGTSLRIDSIVTPMPEIEDAVIGLRRDWVRPDGEVCIDAIEQWRHLREVACGFFYRWNPAPPREWLDRRRNWAKFVRDVLRNNRRGIDSESQVMRACDREEYDSGALTEWRAVRDSYQISTEAVWLSDRILKMAAAWMKQEKGIVWVEHIEFGHELSRRTGVPYYWRGGQNREGKPIEDHPPGAPLIASVASNSEGRNLQAWSTNLIISPPTTGSVMEQLVGRTHRDGQEADEVSVTLSIGLREQVVAFERACADAQYISDTTGQQQKLSYADIDVVAQHLAP